MLLDSLLRQFPDHRLVKHHNAGDFHPLSFEATSCKMSDGGVVEIEAVPWKVTKRRGKGYRVFALLVPK